LQHFQDCGAEKADAIVKKLTRMKETAVFRDKYCPPKFRLHIVGRARGIYNQITRQTYVDSSCLVLPPVFKD
jgi:hypothetical protein